MLCVAKLRPLKAVLFLIPYTQKWQLRLLQLDLQSLFWCVWHNHVGLPERFLSLCPLSFLPAPKSTRALGLDVWISARLPLKLFLDKMLSTVFNFRAALLDLHASILVC